MAEATNRTEKIGGMIYHPGTYRIKEEDKLILPIGNFRKQLLREEQYDAEIQERDLKDGFSFMLRNLVNQIDNKIIPEYIGYAIYYTKTKEMHLSDGIILMENERRRELDSRKEGRLIYIYLMRKFSGIVKLRGEYVCYDKQKLDYYKGIDAKEELKPIYKPKGPKTAFERRQSIRSSNVR